MKWYGILGLLMIIFSGLNLAILKVQPFLSWNFPIVWFGIIFLVDSLVYELKGNSLLSNFKKFARILLLSVVVWWIFEFFNLFTKNWYYYNIPEPKAIAFSISFSTVLPAVIELFDLVQSLHIFDKFKIKKIRISRNLINVMFILGLITFVLPIIIPIYFFWAVWLTFFFLFDPINYLNKQPSILGYLENGKISVILSLLLAGIIAGFLWEFWNNWALAKWVYNIPFISSNFPKLFEMPLPGYLGYFPFALELFAIYSFAQSFFIKKMGSLGFEPRS